MRGLTATLSAGLMLVSLLLSGCAPSRDLPALLPSDQLRSLDICGLVPFDQVKQDHPDLTFNYGGRLVIGPDSCWFQLADNSSVWLSTIGEPLPKRVTQLNRDGLTETEVPGGVVLHEKLNRPPYCDVSAVSDAGVVFDLATTATSSSQSEAQCSLAVDLATLALANATEGLPTIEWPADSLYAQDICAAVQGSGVLDAMGLGTEELESSASARSCTVRFAGDSEPFHSVKFSTVIGTPRAKDGSRSVTVGDRKGTLHEQTDVICILTVDFGNNPVLAGELGTKQAHESLQIEANQNDGVGCETLVDLVGPLL